MSVLQPNRAKQVCLYIKDMSPRRNSSRVPAPQAASHDGWAQPHPPGNFHLLIVDDHTIVRDGLKQLLAESFPGLHIGEAADSKDALGQLDKNGWDVVLLDISLPGQSGLEILKDIRTLQPNAKVLVLTMHPESQYAMRVLKAGAAGYLTKETAASELVVAVTKILSGHKYISAAVAEKLVSCLERPLETAPHELLSDREYQIMRMLATGKTVKEISFELSLSIKTVSTYRVRVLTKMDFKSNADVIRYALEEKLIN
jgi:two-component system invasion response regulator UvrY